MLNKWTFLGEEGSKLAAEVTEARAMKLPIVLAHETDGARGGCEFSEFFKTTPQELINDGLYNMIAIACHQPPHRDVSRACTKPRTSRSASRRRRCSGT